MEGTQDSNQPLPKAHDYMHPSEADRCGGGRLLSFPSSSIDTILLDCPTEALQRACQTCPSIESTPPYRSLTGQPGW